MEMLYKLVLNDFKFRLSMYMYKKIVGKEFEDKNGLKEWVTGVLTGCSWDEVSNYILWEIGDDNELINSEEWIEDFGGMVDDNEVFDKDKWIDDFVEYQWGWYELYKECGKKRWED